MSRVFSGIQPTGNLHLGNYLGAIRNWVTMQDVHECIYCVVDLHAITTSFDPPSLRQGIHDMTAALLASGIDPDKAILFPQSRVRAHAELAWILQCVARVGWLDRMTQFKDKSAKGSREGSSAGLYAYPVLQAADILAYRAQLVPVGEDQKQHLELARDIAIKFNNDVGVDLLIPPDPLIQGPATRVMSLRDGTAKMSKSDPSDASRINLSDDADTIAQKVKRARTDPEPLPSEPAGLAGRPEAANLVAIMAALTERSVDAVLRDHGGQGFGQFKPALADLMVATISPITARFNELRCDTSTIDAVLANGAAQARAIAEPVLAEVHRAVGFTR